MSKVDDFLPMGFMQIAHDIENAMMETGNITIGDIDRAWMRTGISRAYYGVFLTLREEILKSKHAKSITFDGTDHMMVYNILLNILPSHLSNIPNDFGTLRTLRDDSDYHMPYFDPPHKFEVTSDILRFVIRMAEGIMNKIDDIRNALTVP